MYVSVNTYQYAAVVPCLFPRFFRSQLASIPNVVETTNVSEPGRCCWTLSPPLVAVVVRQGMIACAKNARLFCYLRSTDYLVFHGHDDDDESGRSWAPLVFLRTQAEAHRTQLCFLTSTSTSHAVYDMLNGECRSRLRQYSRSSSNKVLRFSTTTTSHKPTNCHYRLAVVIILRTYLRQVNTPIHVHRLCCFCIQASRQRLLGHGSSFPNGPKPLQHQRRNKAGLVKQNQTYD